MHDLALLRSVLAFAAGEPLEVRASALVGWLERLAARPLPGRVPWLGAALALAEHDEPRVRAAVVRALLGATGPAAISTAVHALDDRDEGVRRAAVASLRELAEANPERFAHVVFHPSREVRALGLERPYAQGTEELLLHLLADPELAPAVLAARVPARLGGVGVVADLLGAGRLEAKHARALLSEVRVAEQLAWAGVRARRSEFEALRVLDVQGLDPNAASGADRLDVLFALHFGGDEAHAAMVAEAWADAVEASPTLCARVAAAIAVAAPRPLSAPAANLLARCHPPALAWASIARETRAAAAVDFYRHPPRLLGPLAAERLLDCDLARRPTGEPDLAFLGAVLLVTPDRASRFDRLTAHFGAGALRDAFLSAPVRSAPILGVPGRGRFLEGLVAAVGPRGSYLRALAAAVSGADQLRFLEATRPAERIEIVEHLLALELAPVDALPARRPEALAAALTRCRGFEVDLVEAWLARPDCAESMLGPELLRHAGRRVPREALAERLAGLDAGALERLLGVLDAARDRLGAPDRGALSRRLLDHASPAVAAWAERQRATPRPLLRSSPGEVRELSEEQARAIREAPDLRAAVAPCLGVPCRGLAVALEARAPVPADAVVAAALLGCHDEPACVARQLERFAPLDDEGLRELDDWAGEAWGESTELSLFGHAWLGRQEPHAFAVGRAIFESDEPPAERLERADRLGSELVSERLWAAAARALETWSRREPERVAAVAQRGGLERLHRLCLDRLDTVVGLSAARLLLALNSANLLALDLGLSEALRWRAIDCSSRVRAELAPLVSTTGVKGRPTGAREVRLRVDAAELEVIGAISEPAELLPALRSARAAVVYEAASRALSLGPRGVGALLEVLLAEPVARHFEALVEALALVDDGAALEPCRRSLSSGEGMPAVRFALAMLLVKRGEAGAQRYAVDALGALFHADRTPARREIEQLYAPRATPGAEDPLVMARALATSPHPQAYVDAVERLLIAPAGAESSDALRRLLAEGDGRLAWSRRRAAARLLEDGDDVGLPLLVEAASEAGSDGPVLEPADPRLVEAAARSVLAGGDGDAQRRLIAWLGSRSDAAAEAALERLVVDGADTRVRRAAIRRLPQRPRRAEKLRALAEAFAWGRRISRALTGRLLTPHLIASEALGHTRLRERVIHVSPLPLMRGDARGRDIVEGLLLHEIGHHRYHGGDEGLAVWDQASSLGLFRLLNLVADEHLERNLRAMEGDYGDRLKRLAAYAFQHAAREIPVFALLDGMGARAFDALTRTKLRPARNPRSVRVHTGEILGGLAADGSSFARFVRALRMGLGDRDDDPKVRRALALFGRSFRRSAMPELLEITRALEQIFGDEARLAETFGGPESLDDDDFRSELEGCDEGIEDDELQREVERVMGPPTTSGGARGGLHLNVAPEARFAPIEAAVRVPRDPARHRPVAREVARHARRLRRTFQTLGLAESPARMRLRGRRLDRTRLMALVTRGDPRVLVARQTRPVSDLHLALLIDCSGSMKGASMQRAHAFGVLLCEAARGLAGVDVRVFGFDDEVIYDAGDARRAAVTSLEPGGGNNDAAALFYAAKSALRSPRSAKLIVMISDGLPTECSVTALRSLVSRLERRGLVCAQVAVRPLEEVCFTHYVEIEEDALDAAVRRFERIVTRLVRKSLGR